MQVLKRIVWCEMEMEGNGLITTASTQRNSTARQLEVGEGNVFYHMKLKFVAILAITLNQIGCYQFQKCVMKQRADVTGVQAKRATGTRQECYASLKVGILQ